MAERRGRMIGAALCASAFLACGMTGCATAPRGDLDIARQQVRSLRGELAQTKDDLARLRTENRDMASRAVEDSRRVAELEDSTEHLESSVAAYQRERDEYASALDDIKRAVVATGDAPRTAAMPTGRDKAKP